MTIIPFDRRTIRIWEAEGTIPDDQSTREHAAHLCARLLHEYDALCELYVAQLGKPVPSVQRRNPKQPELFTAAPESGPELWVHDLPEGTRYRRPDTSTPDKILTKTGGIWDAVTPFRVELVDDNGPELPASGMNQK